MHIFSRPSWGAKSPKPRSRQSASNVREFFIHWPGRLPATWKNVNTVSEEKATMRSIQDFHMGPERKWSDFAYSFAVFNSGRVYRGRGMSYVPAAQFGHNTNTVAVCVFIGPDDTVSKEALAAIKRLLHHCEHYAGRKLIVRPHRAVTSTECPGPQLIRLLEDIR